MNGRRLPGNKGLWLWLALALPPLRQWLESSMVGHMGLQMPALVLAGMWLAVALPARIHQALQAWNGAGVPGIALVIVMVAYWALPRSLDAALNEAGVEALKFLTLPLLVGIPLKLSWPRLGAIGRGIIWSNGVAMLFVMAWLYLEAPMRICNNYLLNQQALLGWFAFALGVSISLALAVRLLAGDLLHNPPSSQATGSAGTQNRPA